MNVAFVDPYALACSTLQRGLTSKASFQHYYAQMANPYVTTGDGSMLPPLVPMLGYGGNITVKASPYLVDHLRGVTSRSRLPSSAWLCTISGFQCLSPGLLPVLTAVDGNQYLLPADVDFELMRTQCIEAVLAPLRAMVDEAYRSIELQLGFLPDSILDSLNDAAEKALKPGGVLDSTYKTTNISTWLEQAAGLVQYMQSLQQEVRTSMAGMVSAEPVLIYSLPGVGTGTVADLRSVFTLLLAVRQPELAIVDEQRNQLQLLAPHVRRSDWRGKYAPETLVEFDARAYFNALKPFCDWVDTVTEQNRDIDTPDNSRFEKTALDYILDDEVAAYRDAAAMVAAQSVPGIQFRFAEIGRRFQNGAQGLSGY